MRLALAVAALTTAAIAHADPPPEAVEVDRLDSPPGRPELGFDGGAPVGDWALSAQLGYLDRPITLNSGSGTIVPVAHRETLVLGGALEFGRSIVLDLALPLAHQDGARFTGLGDDRALAHDVTEDLRIGARLQVNDHVFVRGEVTAPTGDEFEFAGAPGYTLAWSLIGRVELPGGVILAGTGGIRIRGTEVTIADRTVGDELFGAAGVVVPLPVFGPLEHLAVSGEAVGVVGDEVHGVVGPSPVEARLGVVARICHFQIGARVGAGLDDQLGAPRWRAMVEVAWHAGPLVKPPETAHEVIDDDE